MSHTFVVMPIKAVMIKCNWTSDVRSLHLAAHIQRSRQCDDKTEQWQQDSDQTYIYRGRDRV